MEQENAVIPSLTIHGFIKDKTLQMYKLFEYFLASEYSQSNMFYGDVVSLKYLVQEHKDPSDLRHGIMDALNRLYSRHYDYVVVNVDVQESDESSVITFNIDVHCKYKDKVYTLSKDIATKKADILNFDNLIQELYEGDIK